MKLCAILTVLIAIFVSGESFSQDQEPPTSVESIDLYQTYNTSSTIHLTYMQYLKDGLKKLYSNKGLIVAGSAAALIANTKFDEILRRNYNDRIKSDFTNDFSKSVKPLGNGRIMFPTYPLAMLIGKITGSKTLFAWGKTTFNASAFSAAGMLASQSAFGASRPYHERGSGWWRSRNPNAASGHTWVSAIPLISAAKLSTNTWIKGGFYAASTLTGLSRINDDAHYTSQVLFGYAWALIAVNSFLESNKSDTKVKFGATANGMSLSWDFD